MQAALADVQALRSDQLVALIGIGVSGTSLACSPCLAYGRHPRGGAVRLQLLTEGAPVADVYVALSESGRSAETVGALRRITARRVGITNGPDSPMTEVVDELVLLDSGPDSPIYTTGYTASLQAVGMLGGHWLGGVGDWSMVPQQVTSVMARSTRVVDDIAQYFGDARMIDVIGSGTSTATAGEGALVLREAARAHTATHGPPRLPDGPMESLDLQTACIVVGDGREVRLASEVSSLGCRTLITSRADVHPTDHLAVVSLPPTASPLARADSRSCPCNPGRALADARGFRIDGFRYEQDDIKWRVYETQSPRPRQHPDGCSRQPGHDSASARRRRLIDSIALRPAGRLATCRSRSPHSE